MSLSIRLERLLLVGALLGVVGLAGEARAQETTPSSGDATTETAPPPATSTTAPAAEATGDGPAAPASTAPAPAVPTSGEATSTTPAAPASVSADDPPVTDETDAPPSKNWHKIEPISTKPILPRPDPLFFRLDLGLFLVPGKVMIGPSIGFDVGIVGFDMEFDFIYKGPSAEAVGFEGSFIGALVGFHLMVSAVQVWKFEVRAGTGFDMYGLWGINLDEYKYAWPFIAEVRYSIFTNLDVLLQTRFYALSSDGLEVGVDYDGEGAVPLLFSTGIGGQW